jgi:hypothetical protein
MQPPSIAGESLEGKAETMKRSWRSSWARSLGSGLVIGLTFVLAGDRAATQTGGSGGIDPLDVLNLQVRPNVFVLLDSSGSMRERPDATTITGAGFTGSDTPPEGEFVGDDPQSKLFQAKQVLRTFVDDNEDKVSFLFARYQQNSTTTGFGPETAVNTVSGTPATLAGTFVYTVECASTDTACMTAADSVLIASGGSTGLARNVNDVYPCTVSSGNCTAASRTGAPFSAEGTKTYFLYKTLGTSTAATQPPNSFYNGETVVVRADGTSGVVTLGADVNPPYVDVQTLSSTSPFGPIQAAPVRFTYRGINWIKGNTTTSCGGFQTLVNLAQCGTTSQIGAISPFLDPEIVLDSSGNIPGYNGTATSLVAATGGIRASGFTPIAESLQDFKTYFTGLWTSGVAGPPAIAAISAQTVKQRSFAIIVTDGDDTCSADTTTSFPGTNNDALRSAFEAQQLFQTIATPGSNDPASSVETFVIVFGSGAATNRANWIAWGGSGMVNPGGAPVAYGDSFRWAAIPTAAERTACTTCRDAFVAADADALAAALQSAISQSVGTGEFSGASPTLASVFELAGVTDPTTNSLNPNTRYNERVNILYQPTFEMPQFTGHLYAFKNDGTFQDVGIATNLSGAWDAGDTLFTNISVPLSNATGATSGQVDRFTFAELHEGATIRDIATSRALIKRRIFTSSPTPASGRGICATPGTPGLNCTYTRNATNEDHWDGSQPDGNNAVALWPPNQSGLTNGVTDIDPPAGTAGPLDDAFGIGAGSNPVLTFAQLQAQFRACDGSTDTGGVPAACTGGSQLDEARKEARQIILAYIAGARVALSENDGKPLRINPAGALLYRSRGWLLMDTTIGQPAVATPPLRSAPSTHVKEFFLFRDGRRDSQALGINEIDKGYGLRNPDFDNPNPESQTDLKPVMTVVYHPANDMLHAFRAGPSCDIPGRDPATPLDPNLCTTAGGDGGSEELWGFIPFDQLGKLKSLISNVGGEGFTVNGQVRNPHVYMIATSPRLVDIFVPGTFSLNDANGNPVTYDGRWRTVLYFGRGPGGKFLTGLDITSPGPFTRKALETNPPFVMWNHGNEDGVADAYDGMGETWSVPAVGNVSGTPEWRLWVGSGYSSVFSEGKRFYMLDAVTGDVLVRQGGSSCPGSDCYALPVGDRSSPTFIDSNTLVASPAAYNPFFLDLLTVTQRSTDEVQRVYIPDVHGRIWKFNTSSGGLVRDEGEAQPFGSAVALMKIGSTPFVFANSGNDSRVPESAGPFKAFAYTDGASSTDLSTALTPVSGFPIDLVDGTSRIFRGTTQPATAFNNQGVGRVFFVATRFNPPGATCISSFSTILFGLSATTGSAVYDFDGSGGADMFALIEGQKGQSVQIAGGQVIVGGSGNLTNPPSPPPPPDPSMPPPQPAASPAITVENLKSASGVCR